MYLPAALALALVFVPPWCGPTGIAGQEVADTGALRGSAILPATEGPVDAEALRLRIVVVAPEGHGARAARVLDLLESMPPLPGLAPDLPRYATVILAPTEEAFLREVGGEAPEWGAAVALPDRGRIILPSYPSDRGREVTDPRVLRHEWAHLGLHQALDGKRIPRWFSEGYAEWAGGWDATQAWRLRLLFTRGRAPSLDSLTLRWPGGRVKAETAYMLSATAVEYLVRESGERGLRLLVDRWAEEGGSFEAALRQTYGVTPGQFEEDWRAYVKDRYGWLFALSHSMAFWSLLGVVLTLMWRVRARHRREQLARLRASEIPDDPAYWLSGVEGGGAEVPTLVSRPSPGPATPER